jgi:hypothetical protein
MRRFAIVGLFGAACSNQGGTAKDPATDDGGETQSTPVTEGADDSTPVDSSGAGPAGPESSDGADPVGDPPIIFDVGGVDDPAGICANKADGGYCTGREAFTCEGGELASTTSCMPNYCLDGTCVDCLTGMNACQGDRVMTCNDGADPPAWQEVEQCNAAAGEACDIGLVTCVDLAPVGDTLPTGTYYKYADFSTGAIYQGGCDVDSFDNRIYVSGGSPFETFITEIDVYEVELVDSDGDGEAERNQHPDNPDEPGEIEERILSHVDTIPIPSGIMYLQASEIYAFEDRLIISGEVLTELDLDTHETTTIATAPTWATGAISAWPYSVSFLGYDDINQQWYAGNEADRRVFHYHPQSDSWGLAFSYPFLAGSHMDGIEVVTDPATQIPYVYVSDMTSDFIGQYRQDPDEGWVQQNLFSYADLTAADVEGLGFGAFGHFWISSLSGQLYEIGGGDLTDYLPDPDPAG